MFNIAIIILFTLSIKVIAGEISGVPSIIDGDTVKILNKRIRFHGIDTPEKKQTCIKNSTSRIRINQSSIGIMLIGNNPPF